MCWALFLVVTRMVKVPECTELTVWCGGAKWRHREHVITKGDQQGPRQTEQGAGVPDSQSGLGAKEVVLESTQSCQVPCRGTGA